MKGKYEKVRFKKVYPIGKLFSMLMVFMLSVTFICPMTAMAAENTGTKTHIEFADRTELKSQEPVEVAQLSADKNMENPEKLGAHIDISDMEQGDLPTEAAAAEPKGLARAMTEEATTGPAVTVIAGTVSDNLSATGDAKIYSINLQPGVYIQAQLTQPANANLDYNLYLLDENANILAFSEYATQLNGTNGTLPEALGYITSGQAAATYYLYVYSANGGSISQAYTLDYSISSTRDNYEIDEYASRALSFTFGTGGAYVNTRNLSSPVDNDWYVITVPSSRIYDKLQITAATSSANGCSVQVYKNIAASGYKMQCVNASGNKFPVSTGTYYIRVSNAKTLEEYDDTDIQNYTLTITPVLRADTITITDLNGTEGLNHVVNYGDGYHFRTGTGTLTISGYATVRDTSTNTTYIVPGVQITGEYYNPYWERNNTPSCAVVTNTGVTDSTGRFNISIILPPAIGSVTYYTGMSIQHYDICEAQAFLSDNTAVRDTETIYHLGYTTL